MSYITRRFTEEIDNTFLARHIAGNWLQTSTDKLGEETVAEHFSYIVSIFTGELKKERIRQEEEIFLKHLEAGHLVLAVSDEKSIGFKVPEIDSITVTSMPNTYIKNLFTDVEVATMNNLEHSIAQILENQQKLVWWFRNRVAKNFYSIQGWHENKIHPDFIVARKKDDDKIELVYILEAKGEQLANNPDTLYKKKVLDKMTEIKKRGKLKAYQTEIHFETLNEAVEGYLIEENKEQEQIRKLMSYSK
jgi:type III restriction enzyme